MNRVLVLLFSLCFLLVSCSYGPTIHDDSEILITVSSGCSKIISDVQVTLSSNGEIKHYVKGLNNALALTDTYFVRFTDVYTLAEDIVDVGFFSEHYSYQSKKDTFQTDSSIVGLSVSVDGFLRHVDCNLANTCSDDFLELVHEVIRVSESDIEFKGCF